MLYSRRPCVKESSEDVGCSNQGLSNAQQSECKPPQLPGLGRSFRVSGCATRIFLERSNIWFLGFAKEGGLAASS